MEKLSTVHLQIIAAAIDCYTRQFFVPILGIEATTQPGLPLEWRTELEAVKALVGAELWRRQPEE